MSANDNDRNGADNVVTLPRRRPSVIMLEADADYINTDAARLADELLTDTDHDTAWLIGARACEIIDQKALRAKADRILGPARGFDPAPEAA